MKRIILILLLLCSFRCYSEELDRLNVVWETPSENSFGSMPLGNGDIGMNVWTEPNGDILFYISKVNAFDAGHELPKLGRIRMRFEPALNTYVSFRQELSLRDATIFIEGDGVELELCVSANQPLIYLKGKSKTQRKITYTLEPLRPINKKLEADKGTEGVLLDCASNGMGWAYVNHSSVWGENLRKQNTAEFVAKAKDPILGRVSGCLLSGKNLHRKGDFVLATEKKCKEWEACIRVESFQPSSLDEFENAVSAPVEFDRKGHLKYWKEFWNRSFINVISCGNNAINLDQCRYTQIKQGALAYEGHKLLDPKINAWQLTQRYALERFCEAIASRGEVPPPYNGSIFTMDMPAGVLGFDKTKPNPVSPDNRDWAILSFMWQNTRHPYWSMATRGDYDCMVKGMEFVKNGLEVCKDHCKKIFGHDGAFIMEASWWHNVGVFNWEQVPNHLRYHQLATIELPAIMCQYYEHTRDRAFLDSVLVPCADEFIKFYQLHFPERDDSGCYVMKGVGCAETYQGVTNPCTEIGCLKFLLDKLLSFDIEPSYRNKWEQFRKILPSNVPTKTVRGKKLLAVGDEYDPGRTNCESPELYSVYPFCQVWLGKPEMLNTARLSFHLRTVSVDGTNDSQGTETGGWQSAPVQAAYLGLPREATRLASINFNDQFVHWNDNIPLGTPFPNRPRPRFPAFWECKMDGTPDNDHGANSVNCLQSMLLQSDGEKIFLLPAWPEDWDVSFKLKASGNTTVECEYRNGRVVKLEVTPKSRLKDIVNMATPESRIRTLVETAMCDYNYLFFLPPMLDAQPVKGPATSHWLSQYGFTIEGCKAGPWENSLFRDNVVYVHLFDWDGQIMVLPSINHKLISSKAVLGQADVEQTAEGVVLSNVTHSSHTVIELTFDSSVEDAVYGLINKDALFEQKELNRRTDDSNMQILEKVFPETVSFDRFEFVIDNPNHLRGVGKPYRIEVLSADGKWERIYEGEIFGLICGKRIKPVSGKGVRLVVQADNVQNFNVYKTTD